MEYRPPVLKPCPKCGHTEADLIQGLRQRWFVMCENCQYTQRYFLSQQEACAAWNAADRSAMPKLGSSETLAKSQSTDKKGSEQ